MTMALTTHSIDEAERCDRVAILDQGDIVAIGSPDELKRQIGSDVLSIAARNPEALARRLERLYGLRPALIDGMLRIECDNGDRLIPKLSRVFHDDIAAISLAKPTLADVFVHYTGRHFPN